MNEATETCRRLVLTQFGEDFRSSVEVVADSIPRPGADDLVVHNAVVGIDAWHDLMLSRNAAQGGPVKLPCDLGAEAVGTVSAVGKKVTGIREGDSVLTEGLGLGYREFAVVPTEAAVKVDAVTPELLALIPGGVLASIALDQCGELREGETVLVTGAAGSAGHIAVQLAKQAGNRVIGICGTPSRARMLRELGCDRAVNHRDETVRDVLEDEYPKGIDLVLDTVGGKLFDACVEHIAPLGRIVVMGFAAEREAEPEAVKQTRIYHRLFSKSASVRCCSIPPHYLEHVPAHRERVLALYAEGKLQGVVDKTVFSGVESIPDAVEHQLQDKACGKVVVRL